MRYAIFNFFTFIRLLLMKKHANKMRVRTSVLYSACVSKINSDYEGYKRKFGFHKEKLIVKYKKLRTIMSDRDEYGKIFVKESIYTQKELEHLKGIYRMYWFILILFIGAEMGLYYLTSEVILMNANVILKLLVSLLLAFIGIFLFNQFFERHFDYVYAKANKEKLNLTDADISTKRLMAIVGYVLGILALGLIILAALVRILYIENIDTTGMTEQEINFANKLNLIIALLMLVVTVAIAIGLALFKKANHDNIIEYKNSKSYFKTLRRTNTLRNSFKGIMQSIEESYKHTVEECWQLFKDLETIWGIDVDDSNSELYKELKNEKYNGTFIIDLKNFNKYKDILNADKDLFEFGIFKDTHIMEIIKDHRIQFHEILSLFEEKNDKIVNIRK